MAELPNWVYDVVMALEEWNANHPRLLAEFYPDYKPKPVDDCGCKALAHVPAEVLQYARVMRHYLARRGAEQPPATGGVVAATGGPLVPANTDGCIVPERWWYRDAQRPGD